MDYNYRNLDRGNELSLEEHESYLGHLVRTGEAREEFGHVLIHSDIEAMIKVNETADCLSPNQPLNDPIISYKGRVVGLKKQIGVAQEGFYQAVSQLSALKLLNIGSLFGDEQNFDELKTLPELHTLDLTFTYLRPEKIRTLYEMPSLKRLTLQSTGIQPLGVMILSRRPALDYLNIKGNGLSDSLIQVFKQQWPNAMIAYRDEDPREVY